MTETDVFVKVINALSSMAIKERRSFRKRVAEAGDAEATRIMVEVLGCSVEKCPNCGSERRHRHGSANGLQRYRCLGCARTYNALSGSDLARLKRRDRWLKFAYALISQMTIRESARFCGIAKNTALLWRHRMTGILGSAQAQKLTGIAEFEELYIRENQKGARQLGRMDHTCRGGIAKRSQPRPLVSVIIGRDRTKMTCAHRLPARTLSAAHTVLTPLVARDAVICSAGHQIFTEFSEKSGISRISMNSGRYEAPAGHAFHHRNVSSFIAELKVWMVKFRGVSTRHLQKYLNWRVWQDAAGAAAAPNALLRDLLKQDPT